MPLRDGGWTKLVFAALLGATSAAPDAAGQHGVASCSADGRTWDNTCSGGRGSGGGWTVPAVNPREEAAWAYNSIGNQAYNAGRYDEAIEYYQRALERIENASIRQNLRDAQVQRLDQLATAEWQSRNWPTVIRLLSEAYGINHDGWVGRNLAKARANQYGDWGSEYFSKKDYDQAILYWQEAYRLDPWPGYLDNIRNAHEAKLGRRLAAAYNSGDHSGAIEAARERLRGNPGDAWAASLMADSALSKPAASIGELRAQLDEALMALRRAAQANPGDRKLAEKAHNYRAEAFFALTRYASEKSVPNGWDQAVQALERWGMTHDQALNFLHRAAGEAALGMGTWAPAISPQDAQRPPPKAGPLVVRGSAASGHAAARTPSIAVDPLLDRRDRVIAVATDPDAAASDEARRSFDTAGGDFHFVKTDRLPELQSQLQQAQVRLNAVPDPSTVRDLAARGEAQRQKDKLADEVKVLKAQIYVLVDKKRN